MRRIVLICVCVCLGIAIAVIGRSFSLGTAESTGQGYCASLVYSVDVSDDGKRVAAGSADGLVLVWEPRTSSRPRICRVGTAAVLAVRFFSGGHLLACAGNIGDVTGQPVAIVDADTGSPLKLLFGHVATVSSVAISRNGKLLVSGNHDGSLRVWNVPKATLIRALKGHYSSVNSVDISQNGAYAVSGAGDYRRGKLRDPTVRLWDLATGDEVHTFRGHSGVVTSVVLSPDGGLIASGSWDGTVRMWDVETGQEMHRLVADAYDPVDAIAMAPNGELLASGHYSGRIRLWDFHSGDEVDSWNAHDRRVHAVRFSADSMTIVSAGEDVVEKRVTNLFISVEGILEGSVRVWQLNPRRLVRSLQ